MHDTPASAQQKSRFVYTVAQLNREVRELLESGLPLLWLEGEVSNLARPRSGHIYLTLKDDAAQVRCAMFRNRAMLLRTQPENGMQVLVRARVGLYEPRGDYQLIIEHLEEAGDGALRRAFEALKNRLEAEGLFDPARKRPLPALPKRIGVVTSPSGAAVRDILSVLQRRFPAIPVVIYPVQVQGQGAAAEIATAIATANRRGECDVLIVGRGGGSLEDLWAFNEEVVARAIATSEIPVVSAVGHEVDFTIADFVADQRAPTPSAAAELLSPEREVLLSNLQRLQQRLRRRMQQRLQEQTRQLAWLAKRLVHPGRRLQQIGQRLDELEQRLSHAQQRLLQQRRDRLQTAMARLQGRSPWQRLQRLQERHNALDHRLHEAMQQRLRLRHSQLAATARALAAVSPLATLGRGYAIASRYDNQQIIHDANAVNSGERIHVRLHRGGLTCRVEESDETN